MGWTRDPCVARLLGEFGCYGTRVLAALRVPTLFSLWPADHRLRL
ncbi:hypothetical protein [Actinophytocola oryzae]|nr:hypothetical protein [Actinophytocola oryzae]